MWRKGVLISHIKLFFGIPYKVLKKSFPEQFDIIWSRHLRPIQLVVFFIINVTQGRVFEGHVDDECTPPYRDYYTITQT